MPNYIVASELDGWIAPSDAIEARMTLTGSSSLTEPTMKRKSLFERFQKIEEKGRNVVDAVYWGAPVGTPLPLPRVFTSGMSTPSGPTSGASKPVKKATKKMPKFEFVESVNDEGRKIQVATDEVTGARAVVTPRTLLGDKYFELEFYSRPKQKFPDDEYQTVPPSVMPHMFTDVDHALRKGIYLLKRPYIKAAEEEAKYKKRKQAGIGSLWEGAYGIDWSEDGTVLVDEDDAEGRTVLALEVASEMGLIYKHLEGTSEEIHFETIETINTLMQTMEKIVPDITMYNPVIGIDADLRGSRTLAYNARTPRYFANSGRFYGQIGSTNFQLGDGIDYDHCAIGLNPDIFADEWDAARVQQIYSNSAGDWWSVDHNSIAQSYGWEDWQSTTVAIVTHEIGHTVANAAFGFILSNRDKDESKSKETSSKFISRLSDIFSEFGLLGESEKLRSSELDDRYVDDKSQDKQALGQASIDRATVTDLLSVYGSVNLHEMMAECWAEYTLAEKPRPFAQAVGTLLQDTMTEFIEYDYGMSV